MHQTSYDNMKSFKEKFLQGKRDEELLIFDIGSCDINGSYRPIFNEPLWEYVGVDTAIGKNVDLVIKDLYSWNQIITGSADVVISGQAFEHMEYPFLAILEIERILKPGGLCCIIAPSGGPDHKYPIDCWRFHPDGFISLARLARMDVLEVYAQWEKAEKNDSVWQDCVLIARKSRYGRIKKLKRRLAGAMLHHSIKLLSG